MSATTQQFFLRWNNYVNHLTYAFDSLRTQEDLVDVTLSCEGRKIRAHKVILSACSTYFREVFQENPCQHPVIVFKNVRYEDLTAIIEFIYQGEVNVVQESLPSFLHTAELLSVQGLTEGAAAEKEEREMPVSKPFAAAAKVQTPIATRSGSSREVARLPPKSTTLTTVTTEAPAPKRKRFYIDSDDNIAIEGLNFVKQSPDTITIENANVEFTPMKIDIPDYIDISTGADEESAGGGGVAEEVLMEDRGDDTAIEDDGGESQEDQDLTETDTTPQILAVRSGSEDVEQTYRVEAVDSSDISTDFKVTVKVKEEIKEEVEEVIKCDSDTSTPTNSPFFPPIAAPEMGGPSKPKPYYEIPSQKRSKLLEDAPKKLLFTWAFTNLREVAGTECGIVAVCQWCGTIIKGSLVVTSNFTKHMRRTHPEQYGMYLKLKEEERKSLY